MSTFLKLLAAPTPLGAPIAFFDGAVELRKFLEARKTQQVKKKRRARVARQHQANAAQSTVNTQPPLPMIDAHCHIFGQNLAGTGGGLDMTLDIISSITADARMGYYGLRPDRQNVHLLLQDTRRFRETEVDDGTAIAVAPQHLDMSYTPLDIPDWIPNKLVPGDLKHKTEDQMAAGGVSDPARYYRSGKKFLWLDRSESVMRTQLQKFGAVAALYCGEVFPFVPFDPRRPNALDFVREAIEQWGFVGVKLYSRCGWMPFNNARMYGNAKGRTLDIRLTGLFDYCTNNDIPLLVHASPTGFPPPGALTLPATFYEGQRLPGFPPEPVMTKEGKLTAAEIAHRAVRWMANYCHYVQLTTSPYSWEPVLESYPTLRLDLAHSGGTLGVYGKYGMSVDANQVNWQHEIEENPFVLGNHGHRFYDHFIEGAKKHALHFLEEQLDPPKMIEDWGNVRRGAQISVEMLSGTFIAREAWRRYQRHKTDKSRSTMVPEIMEEMARMLKPDSVWGQWLQDWKQNHPVDWTTKITELVSKYDNVYTDLAYISGAEDDHFKKLLDNLLTGAESGILSSEQKAESGWAPSVCTSSGAAMAYKNMMATDWFMTAMDKISPFEFWRRMALSITPNTKLWHTLATENALRWLNLDRRFEGEGMKMMESYYQKMWGEPPPMPEWWQALKIYYRSGDYQKLTYTRRRPRSNAVTGPPPNLQLVS